jgi:hypothetical protein
VSLPFRRVRIAKRVAPRAIRRARRQDDLQSSLRW